MPATACEAITRYLREWRAGDPAALEQLTSAIYSELRRVAGGILAGSGGGRTIQPTVLVHELYLHLPGVQHLDWESRGQFFNVAARMMRNALVDYARMQQAARRGGGKDRVPVTGIPSPENPELQLDIIALHDLLEKLAAEYPRHERVVELRYFAGLSEEETAAALSAAGFESSKRTVSRDWAFAKAWLHQRLMGQ
ncbi:MAG: sigma-70 family RNA polymerase sigma factor [Acidobacteria bacterium]|nr:sigma-70 family RNA polymerase sigma factor [Acidobacteriota bacterium]